ncbi:hypothetical protein [Pararhizobium gei]|uniref:hypothetical protein n=1 Tax=Pararhizobium gei TaxID=1395951 RepID=UPI0023DC7129|nr:hypothetical protein [Rhizobium gei]
MTVKEQVSKLIKSKSPDATCDDCIADALKLSVRQHANHKTIELGNAFGFYRKTGICSMCKNTKKVIWYINRI